jgi:GNAT superfamily N-acetyltransferase
MEIECNLGGKDGNVIFADHQLACRLESLVAAEYRRLGSVADRIFPEKGAQCTDAGDGVALWLGAGSPVNTAVGLGMLGPVEEATLQLLEAFYHDRGAAAVLCMCPLADPSLLHMLGRRGWAASGFEHVLVLDAEQASQVAHPVVEPSASEIEVRVCLPEERELWGRMAARGFADGVAEPEPVFKEFGSLVAARDDAILVLAWVDGRPAGTGSLVVDGGVGWLSSDSTLPEYRRRGVQQAVQWHRIELARAAGCDLVVTEAAPGSQSQRNMERLGFRIVYTHAEFTKAA